MECDGEHKEEHSVGRHAGRMVLGVFETAEAVEMRSEVVEEGDKGHAGHYAEERLPQIGEWHHPHARHDEANQRRREHHPGAIAEKDVVPPVVDIAYKSAESRTYQR